MIWRIIAMACRIIPLFPFQLLSDRPTAELRDDQKDTDSLPPIPCWIPFSKRMWRTTRVCKISSRWAMMKKLVTRVIRTVDIIEYKRRQAPPGIKITPRAFGRDRRLPITNRCREY